MCKYLDSRSRSASIQRYALKSFVGSDGPFHQFLKRKNFVGSDGFEPPKARASRFTVCPIWPLW